jgi:hypothetical protein
MRVTIGISRDTNASRLDNHLIQKIFFAVLTDAKRVGA